jgi:hypothetical protein
MEMMLNAYAPLALLILTSCATAQARRADDLPLRAGTSWTYRGTETDSAGTREIARTLRVTESDGQTAKLQIDAQPRAHVLEWRGDTLYRDGDPWLAWPFVKGKRTCADPKICWVVEGVDSVTLEAKGVSPVRRTRWLVVERDNTGVMTVEIVAGVGVAAFRYHHNGSPDDVDVKLVEVSR